MFPLAPGALLQACVTHPAAATPSHSLPLAPTRPPHPGCARLSSHALCPPFTLNVALHPGRLADALHCLNFFLSPRLIELFIPQSFDLKYLSFMSSSSSRFPVLDPQTKFLPTKNAMRSLSLKGCPWNPKIFRPISPRSTRHPGL